MLKLVAGSEFDVSKKTVAATKLADGDSLLNVCVADNFNQIVLQTENGYFIRFPMMNIPEMKKTAIGVRGINLSASDSVTGAYPLDSNIECKIIHNDKEVILNKLKLVNRGGKGTKIRV
jgi:DNA gyrase subunit A